MTREGFQLDPTKITEQIRADVTEPGWHLTTWFDTYAHPDRETGLMWVHEAVDRAVVVFVGSRDEAAAVASAAVALKGDS